MPCWSWRYCPFNPPTTTRVKISQQFSYTSWGQSSALKSQTMSNLTCNKYIYRSKWVDCFCLVLFRMVKMTVKSSQKCPWVHVWVNSKKRQLTDFDLYSNFQLKCLNSRKVKTNKQTLKQTDHNPTDRQTDRFKQTLPALFSYVFQWWTPFRWCCAPVNAEYQLHEAETRTPVTAVTLWWYLLCTTLTLQSRLPANLEWCHYGLTMGEVVRIPVRLW